jgi:hypothetical protein
VQIARQPYLGETGRKQPPIVTSSTDFDAAPHAAKMRQAAKAAAR